MKHAEFGPSAADRWVRCPRSHYLHKNSFKSSPYADEGTVGHWIGEQCLLDPRKRPIDWLDEVITYDTHPDLKDIKYATLVTEDFCEAVEEYVDHVNVILEKIGDGGMVYKIEQKVKLNEHCWGTSDCLIVDKENRTLYIIDLKMGRGVSVWTDNNYQLMIYGAAALEMMDPLSDWYPKTVITQIIQPRIMGEQTLRETTHNADELSEWAEIPKDRVQEILEGSVETLDLVPGEKQCRWCGHSAKCRGSAEHTFKKAGLEFAEFIVEPKIVATENITDKEIGLILAGLPMLDTWKKAIQAEGLARVKTGGEIPGYKVVESTKFRQYKDPAVAETYLKQHLSDDKLYKKKMLTPAQAEKALGKKTEEGQVLTTDYIYKPAGDAQLVPESNKKPEMKFSASDEFSDFAT